MGKSLDSGLWANLWIVGWLEERTGLSARNASCLSVWGCA